MALRRLVTRLGLLPRLSWRNTSSHTRLLTLCLLSPRMRSCCQRHQGLHRSPTRAHPPRVPTLGRLLETLSSQLYHGRGLRMTRKYPSNLLSSPVGSPLVPVRGIVAKASAGTGEVLPQVSTLRVARSTASFPRAPRRTAVASICAVSAGDLAVGPATTTSRPPGTLPPRAIVLRMTVITGTRRWLLSGQTADRPASTCSLGTSAPRSQRMAWMRSRQNRILSAPTNLQPRPRVLPSFLVRLVRLLRRMRTSPHKRGCLAAVIGHLCLRLGISLYENGRSNGVQRTSTRSGKSTRLKPSKPPGSSLNHLLS